jgi:hypothetical protein
MKRTCGAMKRSLEPSSSALQIPPRQAGFMFFCLGIKAKKMVDHFCLNWKILPSSKWLQVNELW